MYVRVYAKISLFKVYVNVLLFSHHICINCQKCIHLCVLWTFKFMYVCTVCMYVCMYVYDPY